MKKHELTDFLNWLKTEPDFNIGDEDVAEIADDYFFFLKQKQKSLLKEMIKGDEELGLYDEKPGQQK